ncbi:hypothetical protein LTR53_018518 [Teratosphaeriaceae sp. CCFEE 6253]|nr:hypothetical protein LTR53_018518 [Teratosphaeriaceae sp. CCFEE 6253]
MRNLPLALASTAFLHVYLIKILLAYTTNGHFTCRAEFWIMSIYLPFGIALFQANIAQLRSISQRQRMLLSRQMSDSSLESAWSQRKAAKAPSLWLRWKGLSEVERSYVFIGAFMLLQLVMTAVLYATSPILQGDWSSYGPISHAKGQSRCRRSLTW